MFFYWILTDFPEFYRISKSIEYIFFRRNRALHKTWRGIGIFYFAKRLRICRLIFMLTRTQKEQLVKDLSARIKDGKVVIFSDYAGTPVGKMNNLRDELRKTDSSYKITKKKLIDLALKNAGIEASVLNLEGQIGIAIGKEDEVSAAKVLAKFARENKNFKILQGVLDSKVISGKEVTALAALPGREELLAKLVGSINAPVSGFVNALAGNLRNLVGVLRAISDTK